MPRVITPFEQFFDGEGNPLTEGYLQFTVSGTNATDKDTFADVNETIPNANPLALDAEGRCPNAFGTGSYRVTVFTKEGEQISQKDPVEGAEPPDSFPAWDAVSVYSVPNVVIGDDLNMYRTLINSNQDNDPLTEDEFWERVEFEQFYNEYRAYDKYDRCIDSVGESYISKVIGNTGNTPASSPDYWQKSQSVITYILSRYTDLETAISEIGTSLVELWVDQDDFSDATVPANITLRFIPGNLLYGTVYHYGGVIASETQQIVATTGTLIFGSSSDAEQPKVSVVHGEWYGMVGDNSTDNTTAFENAVIGCADRNTIKLGHGTFLVNNFDLQNTDPIESRISIIGSGQPIWHQSDSEVNTIYFGTTLKANSGQTGVFAKFSGTTVALGAQGPLQIKDIGFVGASGTTQVVMFENVSRGIEFENIAVSTHEDATACGGVDVLNCWRIDAKNVVLRHNAANGAYGTTSTGIGLWVHNYANVVGFADGNNQMIWDNITCNYFGTGAKIGGDNSTQLKSRFLGGIAFRGGAFQFSNEANIWVGSGVENVNFTSVHTEKSGLTWAGGSYSLYTEGAVGVYISYNARGVTFTNCDSHQDSGRDGETTTNKAIYIDKINTGDDKGVRDVVIDNWCFSDVGNYGVYVEAGDVVGPITVVNSTFNAWDDGAGVAIHSDIDLITASFATSSNVFEWGGTSFDTVLEGAANIKASPKYGLDTVDVTATALSIPISRVGSTFTNIGATNTVVLTLPLAIERHLADGPLRFRFMKVDPYYLMIAPSSGDLIQYKVTDSEFYRAGGRTLAFTSGGSARIAAGDIITGAISGATAKVSFVELASGAWGDGNAVGTLTIYAQTGTFQAENLNIGATTNVATIAENSTHLEEILELEAIDDTNWIILNEIGPWETFVTP